MEQMENTVLSMEDLREEIPYFTEYFPYWRSRAELNALVRHANPWHWHDAIELLYVERGRLEYFTPKGSVLLQEHSAIFVNTGVLHSTRWSSSEESNIQRVHFFSPEFIGGGTNNAIYDHLVAPLVWRKDIDVIPIHKEEESNRELLEMIRESYLLDNKDKSFDLQIRATLSEIWLKLLSISESIPVKDEDWMGSEVKQLLGFVYDHFAEPITIDDLAAAGLTSRRQVFRIFQNTLHTTPMEYIEKYRVQYACKLLMETDLSITEIAMRCGMNSISYFGKRFRNIQGQTPSEFRKRWHDTAKNGRSADRE